MKKLLLFSLLLLLSAPAAAQKQEMFGQSFAGLVEKLLPGVVNISTVRASAEETLKPDIISANDYIRDYFLRDEGGRTSLGSGFLIDAKGYIITNNHVIDGADEIEVTLSDDRHFKAEVIGADKMTDLALIKITTDEPFAFVNLGNSDDLKVGDWILAIGNPFGLGGSVTAGIVSAKSRDIDAGSYDNFIQTDASINQGSSGGPMFNMQGEVVGINTAIFSSNGGSMGIGFATPINLSKFVVEQLRAKGKVERGWLGLKVISNKEEIALSENQTVKGGVAVSSLSVDAPAAKAGIEVGDIIIAFNGAEVKDAKDFSRRVAETKVGTPVILRVWRNGRLQDISLNIALMPDVKPQPTPVVQLPSEKPAGYVEALGLVAKVENKEVIVEEVLADSDAYIKGIKAGDIIQTIDGKSVSSLEDLQSYAAIAKTMSVALLELKVLSDGLPQVLSLKVGAND